MKLPKSIIKKYGISRKAWSVFRGRKKKAVRQPMAKRRRKGSRRSFGFSRRSFKRSRRRSGGGGLSKGGAMALVIGAGIYGAGREYVSDKLQPLVSKVPAGELSDEVVMGALSYALATGKVPLVNKLPYAREVGRAGLTIEAARVGAYFGNKVSPASNGNSSMSW